MQDARVGQVIRALRRRKGWRQRDLAAAAGTSQTTVSRIEVGSVGSCHLDLIRAVCRELGATCDLDIRSRGPDLDRLIDARHADLCAHTVNQLARHGWAPSVEVSYSRFGERGSIDVLAVHPLTRSALVVEVKSMIVSIEELLRTHDAKVRLAPEIVRGRTGWRPVRVGRLVVMDGTTANRGRVGRAHALLDRVVAGRWPELRAWLREPTGSDGFAGIWFVHPKSPGQAQRSGGPSRVRKPRPG